MSYLHLDLDARSASFAEKILTILTNSPTLTLTDGTVHPSGFWAEEFCLPYDLFSSAGYQLDIGTIDGVAPSVDKSSLDPDAMMWVVPYGTVTDTVSAAQRYKNTRECLPELNNPLDIAHQANRLLAASRAHWHIENRLHWYLDVAFNEDRSRVRKGFGQENLVVLRKLALTLLRREKTLKVGLKAKRLRAGWDHDYLLKILTS